MFNPGVPMRMQPGATPELRWRATAAK